MNPHFLKQYVWRRNQISNLKVENTSLIPVELCSFLHIFIISLWYHIDLRSWYPIAYYVLLYTLYITFWIVLKSLDLIEMIKIIIVLSLTLQVGCSDYKTKQKPNFLIYWFLAQLHHWCIWAWTKVEYFGPKALSVALFWRTVTPFWSTPTFQLYNYYA